jgi:D-proline reductase (dithiol) PrdB
MLTHPAPVNEAAPYTPLPRPLAQCRVAIVTTAGIHLRHDKPFAGGDQGYRVIPINTAEGDILQSHASIGFDRTWRQRDLNIVFPRDRLRELVEQGELGSLGPACFSFMGALRDWATIQGETGPAVARRLRENDVDVVLLTPT